MEKIKSFVTTHPGYTSVSDALSVISTLEPEHKHKVICAMECLIAQIHAHEKQHGQKDYVYTMQEYADAISEQKKHLIKDVEKATNIDIATEGCNAAIAVALKHLTYKDAATVINNIIDIKCICHDVKMLEYIQ